jgi:macrodomain Ter protein organizer (MatP/YcbG family)
MAKQKNESANGVAVAEPPTQLTLAGIDLDDIESIPVESEPVEPPAPVESSAPVADSDDNVIATVQTAEQAFAGDPLAKDYIEFGMEAKRVIDPTDKAPLYVHLGLMICNLMVKEHNIAPGSYERKKVTEKAETALRVCNVPESMVRPNELVGMYQVVLLDRSTPGDEGEPRTFDRSEIPADWFGGNLSVGVLRTLAACTKRVSKPDELDVFDYIGGFEAKVREWIKALRNADLTNSQTGALIAARKKFLAAEKEHLERQGLNPAEIEAVENAKRVETREKRLAEIKSDALTFQKNAAEKLKLGKEDLRDLLSNMQIIPPRRMTPQEYAAQMTPGDAKALVQELIKLYANDPSRLNVFKVLRATCNAIADQIKRSAQASKPLAKTG